MEFEILSSRKWRNLGQIKPKIQKEKIIYPLSPPPKKKILIFREMELPGLNIRTISYILKKESFS